MVNIKIDFTWKVWTAIIVATIGSIIIFGSIAYCLVRNPEKTVEKTTEIVSDIANKSIEIK
jgi:hypothetical protein